MNVDLWSYDAEETWSDPDVWLRPCMATGDLELGFQANNTCGCGGGGEVALTYQRSLALVQAIATYWAFREASDVPSPK